MSIAKRLKYSFTERKQIHFGDKSQVSVEFDSDEMMALKSLLQSFFSSEGILEYEILEDLFRTGGHADIHYRAVRFANQSGGAEVVFAQDEHWQNLITVDPWIELFGAWIHLEENIKALFVEKGFLPQ